LLHSPTAVGPAREITPSWQVVRRRHRHRIWLAPDESFAGLADPAVNGGAGARSAITIAATAVFAHFVAQAPPLVRVHAAPARFAVGMRRALLAPVLAHLPAHFAPLVRRQFAPVAPPRPVHRAVAASVAGGGWNRASEQDGQQQERENTGFHGAARGGSRETIVRRHRTGLGKEM